MVFLYVNTSSLVPAYKYSMNSMVSFYVRTSGLVPAYKGTLGQAIREKPWAWWTTAFKI